MIGIREGYGGLIDPSNDGLIRLDREAVRGIAHIGGTILGTTNRGNPFLYPIETSGGTRDYSARCVEMFHELKLDALVVIGGDGTLAIAHQFSKLGIPLVGVPKTIDNDIVETTMLSINSIKSYIRSAYRKIGVTSRSRAILWGIDHGFQPDRTRLSGAEVGPGR